MLRVIFVLMLFVVGIYLGIRNVHLAACFFIWNDIFRPVQWARSIGFVGSPYFMPVHICTGVLVFSLFVHRYKSRWSFGAWSIIGLLAWVWFTMMFAWDREIAYTQAVKTTKYMLPMVFIAAILVDRATQRLFAYVLAASVGAWLIHHGIITVLSGEPEISMSIRGGQMNDRNDFMVASTACIPLLIWIGWHHKGFLRKQIRLFGKIGAFMGVGAVFYSLSRGAMVGCAMLVCFYAFFTGRMLQRVVLGLVLIVLIIPFIPAEMWERLGTVEVEGEQTEQSARQRLEHMTTAWRVTMDNPIMGCGPNNFPDYSLQYGRWNAEPHSIWLKCSSEYGFTGLFYFLGVLGYVLWKLRHIARQSAKMGDKETEGFAVALACAIFGFVASGTFTSQFLSQYLWALIGLAGAFLSTPRNYPENVSLPKWVGVVVGAPPKEEPGMTAPTPAPASN